MAIRLKSPREVELMGRAGQVVHRVMACLENMLAPGVTTLDLDAEAERMTAELGAEALFKGVPGRGGPFPGTVCASVNEEVVHGIPSRRALREGDLISLDYGCRLDGYCADAAATYIVGQGSPEVRRLVAVTRHVLEMTIERARAGMRWSELAGGIERYVARQGFSVVREFVGHGIGRQMHEDPKVPNFVSRELLLRDIVLQEGLVLAVEPMVALGSGEVVMCQDGWTVVTRDGSPSAHFEHTLAVTAGGVDVLTNGSKVVRT